MACPNPPSAFGCASPEAWSAPYAIADWVDDVADVVADLVDAPVVAVGHSFGTWLALGAAAREPSVFGINGDPSAGSIVSDDAVARHTQLYPGIRQVRLDGLDHQLGLAEQPERVVDAMRPFVAGLG